MDSTMNDQPRTEGASSDADDLAGSMQRVAEESQRLVAEFLSRQAETAQARFDPLNIGDAFMEMTARMMSDPARIVQIDRV